MNIVQKPNTTFWKRISTGPKVSMKRQLPTMHTSMSSMTRPSDMLRYLFTAAAMMSVPPVEPLLRKTMARAVPVIIQPMTSDMKSLPSPRSL